LTESKIVDKTKFDQLRKMSQKETITNKKGQRLRESFYYITRNEFNKEANRNQSFEPFGPYCL